MKRIDRAFQHKQPQPEQWKEQAKCKDSGEDFFAIDYGRRGELDVWKRAELKRIQENFCFLCPVQRECFLYGVGTKAYGGIWGGVLFRKNVGHAEGERKLKKVEQAAREYRKSIAFEIPG